MTTIRYAHDNETHTGTYDLRDGLCATVETDDLWGPDTMGRPATICLPGDPGEAGYGYTHGGERYRALIDAIVERHGVEAIRAARAAR